MEERTEMTLEDKRKALENAFLLTDQLMDDCMNVFRQDFKESVPSKQNFETAVRKVLPDPVIEKPQQPEEDLRLHMSFPTLRSEALVCERCGLCKTRKNVVFGEGCTDRPVVMVIGEGPGENEDETGRPFVGKAGQYLDRWLAAISVSRQTNAFIANTVKCRPPQNRDPLPEEKEACFAFLKQQINLINPQSILCLGKPASTLMTGQTDASMGSLRGRFFFYDGIPMICTYHPAAVLRDESLKVLVWEDLKKLAKFLGLSYPTGRKQ